MKTITIDDGGHIIGYKTVREKAKEFGVSDSMARIYARDGHVEAIYVGNTYYIKDDAKKPDLGKPGRKKRDN